MSIFKAVDTNTRTHAHTEKTLMAPVCLPEACHGSPNGCVWQFLWLSRTDNSKFMPASHWPAVLRWEKSQILFFTLYKTISTTFHMNYQVQHYDSLWERLPDIWAAVPVFKRFDSPPPQPFHSTLGCTSYKHFGFLMRLVARTSSYHPAKMQNVYVQCASHIMALITVPDSYQEPWFNYKSFS